MSGRLCIDGVCVDASGLDGQGFDEDCDAEGCAEGLTCKNLFSRPELTGGTVILRCALETLPELAFCLPIEFPKAWDRLNALQCRPGLTCERVSSSGRGGRCFRTLQAGASCGLDRGILCSEGSECVDEVCR